ncbi:F-box/LRR-repeat protein 7-like [Diorhabda sublineata]|uniref:F-box/LRR-repeat protein 7-like n=1 Tax=Diorhabda sublineata TaxID=1163346 RepID=UPI0024E14873|nr:F-box/LRR-repeat protein 7-like [Diorhabda sublineata]
MFSSCMSLRGNTSLILPIGFGYLPEKVLLNIFQYFDETELRTTIIPVCQQWRTAAEHPSLWNTLKFQGISISTSVICLKIRQFNTAETIIIKEIKEPLIVLRQICRYAQNLVRISLRHCHEVVEDSLRHLIVSCKVLKELDLKGTKFKSLIFCVELAFCQSLSSVNFSDNPYLTISHITSIIMNCRKLNGFHISTFKPINRIYLIDADIYFLTNHTANSLQSLSLDCSNLGNGSFSSILQCKNLQYLCLNFAYNFEGCDFQNLWKTLRKLKTLKVRFGHQITDVNIKNLFEQGKDSLEKLEVIDFTGCSKISNFGIKAIAQSCTNLKQLILRNCKNIFSIDDILKKCSNLEMLNIAFCTNLNIYTIFELKTLRILFISDEKKLKYFIDCLKNKNKNLKLKICDSEFNKSFRNI